MKPRMNMNGHDWEASCWVVRAVFAEWAGRQILHTLCAKFRDSRIFHSRVENLLK
jgi:hypothetical protein